MPVVPILVTVIEATRLPTKAASLIDPPLISVETRPAVTLSPAPTGSTGPSTAIPTVCCTSEPSNDRIPFSPQVIKSGALVCRWSSVPIFLAYSTDKSVPDHSGCTARMASKRFGLTNRFWYLPMRVRESAKKIFSGN